MKTLKINTRASQKKYKNQDFFYDPDLTEDQLIILKVLAHIERRKYQGIEHMFPKEVALIDYIIKKEIK